VNKVVYINGEILVSQVLLLWLIIVKELLLYCWYFVQILEALDDDAVSRRLQLATRFEHVTRTAEEQSSFC